MIYEFTKMYNKMAILYRKVTDSEHQYKELLLESQASERKIAEQSRIIEQMLESSREAIVLCGDDGRVIFTNRRLEQFFGRASVPGESFSEYCSDMMLTRGLLTERLEEYWAGGTEPFYEKMRFVTDEGETRHFECYVIPVAVEAEGKRSGHLVGFRDRTDEEKLDEAKDQFVSTISHEIRTPLSSIVGFIEILATRNVSEEKRGIYIGIIHKEANRLVNLINDFLDL